MSSQHEYQKLIDEIRKHDHLYYVEARPAISDREYDRLMERLKEIEKEHPAWVTPSSPTQRIAPEQTKGFKQQEHSAPMLSLDNTYSKEEVADFIKRVHKLLDGRKATFCCELKVDGTSISVRYEKGLLVRALTRGDGRKGDDVTANVRTIRAVPLELSGSHLPEVLEVRGEVYMPHKVFEALNKEKEEQGEELWANPRNAAAGSLKLLDPQEVAKRYLAAVFYSVVEGAPAAVSTQFEMHEYLERLGLPVFAKKHRHLCTDLEEIFHFADKIDQERHSLPFDIDGVVIKVNELRTHPQLGTTGKSPRYAVAYKFAAEQAKTKVRDITVQVGRTGVLTPVAELEPVFLSGSTIARATLHNQEDIERKDVRIGDTVVIQKAGEVIPEVVEVDFKKRPAHTHPWKMPKECPSCGTPVVQVEGLVAVRCPNRNCSTQRIRRVVHFVSKGAMDIDHMGKKVVEHLVMQGRVTNFSDIYDLTAEDLAKIPGFKEKSIQNLLEGIERSKHVTLARFIFALGIEHVGEETAELLAERAGDLDLLAKMGVDEFLGLEGIGEKIAHALVHYFKDPHHLKEIDALLKMGVKPEVLKVTTHQGHPFFGKVFVLTGSLQEFTRSQAAALIKERGGKVSGTVTQDTDFVLVGEEAGSKLDKAKKWGIPLMTEQEFKIALK